MLGVTKHELAENAKEDKRTYNMQSLNTKCVVIYSISYIYLLDVFPRDKKVKEPRQVESLELGLRKTNDH